MAIKFNIPRLVLSVKICLGLTMYLNLKKCALLFVLTLFGLQTIAQEAKPNKIENPFSVGIGFGAAMPLEDFARSKFSESINDKYGFASTGFNLNLTGAYQLDKHFAIGALLSYNSFSLNNTKIGSEIEANDTTKRYRVAATADKSGYAGLNLMVGPRFIFPVGKVEIFVQPMVGFSSLGSDFQVVSITKTDTNQLFSQNQTNKYSKIKINSGLSHGAIIGLNYPITSKYSLTADLTYLNLGVREYSSDIESNSYSITTLPDGSKEKVLGPVQNYKSNIALMTVATLNINVGFNVRF